MPAIHSVGVCIHLQADKMLILLNCGSREFTELATACRTTASFRLQAIVEFAYDACVLFTHMLKRYMRPESFGSSVGFKPAALQSQSCSCDLWAASSFILDVDTEICFMSLGSMCSEFIKHEYKS